MQNQISKIDSTNESTINGTLEIGMTIRNGANRAFTITALTPTQIQLTSLNGETVKRTVLNRNIFCQLFARKNYEQVYNPNKLFTEFVEAKRVGANRFIIK